jgi:hypothetical protein
MWLGAVGRVAEIEVNENVVGTGEDDRPKVLVAFELRQILGAERVEKIGVATE